MRKNIFLLAGSALLAFILLEIGMRVFGVSYPYFTKVDYYTGYSLRPGAGGWQKDEGEAYIKINSDGLRDHEHTLKKPENTIRIAILGDSYAEAKQVEIEDAFWSVMEKEASKCSDKKVEAINFGVSGFGTAQELMMLRSRVWKYNPDIVLLAFLTGNDIRNNSHALSNQKDEPWFDLSGSGLTLRDDFRSTRFYRFQSSLPARMMHLAINNSRVLQLLNRVRILARNKLDRGESGLIYTHDNVSSLLSEAGMDREIYVESTDKDWLEAWDITERIVVAMNSDVKKHNAGFLVVVLSNPFQVYPDAGVQREAMDYIGTDNIFYPDLRIRQYGDKNGFDVLMLAPYLKVFAQRSKRFLHGFENTSLGRGHWNRLGHKLAGKKIAEYLCKNLL